ncbi:citrate synthase family protein [Sphingomonas oligophenolica]|uniref:citrate synthase (unknown stereospecificity) n=1 Tax=Sphingomonas oligophenolica TaxID=301154 RepID=A0ABU9Y681_9SPHN
MELYIDAEQAAAELGVSLTTLYTYISRRGIRSQRVPGTKKRQYWKADIDNIRKRKGEKPSPPARDTLQESKLTLVTPEGPYYRGQSAIELSETHTLEDTAALLWDIRRDAVFGPNAAVAPPELRDLYKVFKDVSIADKAIGILPFVERANPRAYDLTHEGLCRTGADLLRWYAAILAGRDVTSSEPLHIQTAALCGGEDEVADLIRRVLVISADHGFGAGTYAVRAVASTGVTPYRSVLAGFAIAPGRRNVLGHRAAIGRLLDELAASSDPQSVIARRMQEGEDLPGFRFPWPYVNGDPRANRSLDDLGRIRGDHPLFVKVMAAFSYAEAELGRHPGHGMVNDLIARVIGLPSREYLYPLGRCAGWVAHSIEQYEAGDVDPPLANYRGQLPKVSELP